MSQRSYTTSDRLLSGLQQVLQTLAPGQTEQAPERPHPGEHVPEADLDAAERRLAAALMRVNHCGEVCAQALYQGQAAAADLEGVRQQMQDACDEESEHLAWCETRLRELDSRPSRLTPAFYAGSFLIGMLAGKAGDRWSLGFVAETERQVCKHLREHIDRLPHRDERSRTILEQMEEDEARHARNADKSGAAPLPLPVRLLMRATAKVMTTTTEKI